MVDKEQNIAVNSEQIDKMSFEQALNTLTKIVDDIESGDVELESSLVQYEQGMAIIAHCRKILKDAEKRIKGLSSEK